MNPKARAALGIPKNGKPIPDSLIRQLWNAGQSFDFESAVKIIMSTLGTTNIPHQERWTRTQIMGWIVFNVDEVKQYYRILYGADGVFLESVRDYGNGKFIDPVTHEDIKHLVRNGVSDIVSAARDYIESFGDEYAPEIHLIVKTTIVNKGTNP